MSRRHDLAECLGGGWILETWKLRDIPFRGDARDDVEWYPLKNYTERDGSPSGLADTGG